MNTVQNAANNAEYHTKYNNMRHLIGLTIDALHVDAEAQHFLRFTTTGKVEYTYIAEGDCCSESWFADITGVDALLGGTVIEADTLELPEDMPDDGRGRQDYDIHYGIKLRTDKGYVDIVYRNSSNGYYGGSIKLGAPWSDVEWTPITADWSAQQVKGETQ